MKSCSPIENSMKHLKLWALTGLESCRVLPSRKLSWRARKEGPPWVPFGVGPALCRLGVSAFFPFCGPIRRAVHRVFT